MKTMRPAVLLRALAASVAASVLVSVFPSLSAAAQGSGQVWLAESEIEGRMAEQLSSCVVFLVNDSNDRYITGTLLRSTGTVVLTNYHLLTSTRDAVAVYLNAADNQVERFRCRFIRGDPGRDLALFLVTLQGKTTAELISAGFADGDLAVVGMPYTNRYLAADSFGEDADIRKGYAVAFLGFPLSYGMMIEENSRRLRKKPIYRRGMIASDVFEGEFLIDAMVSCGNSGSPVFVRTLYPRDMESPGLSRGRKAEDVAGGRSIEEASGFNRRSVTSSGQKQVPGYRLVGILKEYQNDVIKMKVGGRTVEVPHNTGLGIVIPIGSVRRFLEGG